jgi:hypothetical protein
VYEVDDRDRVVRLRDLLQSSVGAPLPVVVAREDRMKRDGDAWTPAGRHGTLGPMARSDAGRIRRALTRAGLPRWVKEARVQLMTDHTGDPAAMVSLIVRSGRDAVLADGEVLLATSLRIRGAVSDAGIDRIPYVRFVAEREAA